MFKRFIQLLICVFLLFVFSLSGPPVSRAEPSVLAQAAVTVAVPANVMIGENFDFTVTFDNTSGIGTTGFGPFIDVVLPRNGADGDAGTGTPDGVTFVSAAYEGFPITAVTQRTFPDADGAGSGTTGCVGHPFARDSANNAVTVCGTAGDTLVVIQLPFGSFTVNQPPAEITITAALSDFADPGTALDIYARGGFQFGSDPENNPCCDPLILSPDTPNSGSWGGNPVTPVLLTLHKTGDTDEVVTGPNFTHEFTLTVDITDGETISNLVVEDTIPPEIAFNGLVSVTPAADSQSLPAIDSTGGTLSLTFNSIAGGPGSSDIVIVWEYYIPRLDNGGNEIIDPGNGDEVQVTNTSTAVGDWVPNDPADAASAGNATAPGGAAPVFDLWAHSLAVKKSVSIVSDVGPAGYSPGDTLAYTLAFEVSDFYRADELTLTDIFSDGQQLLITAPYIPRFDITDRAGNFSGDFVLNTDYFSTPDAGGSTRLIFEVSDALTSAGDDGILTGGRFTAPDAGGAVGTVTYYTTIDNSYTNSSSYISGEPGIDPGDLLSNDATLEGIVQGPGSPPPGFVQEVDDAGNELNIVRGGLNKNIYAYNGLTCGACTGIIASPGDTLTYRIQHELPAGDIDSLVLTDYLPIPTFAATEVTAFNAVTGIPVAGVAQFGPLDTFGQAPAITTDAAENTVIFTFASANSTTNTPLLIDLLFTVTITDVPFADNLQLTNLVQASEQTSQRDINTQRSLSQFRVSYPLLTLRKGAVSSDATAVYNPPLPGGVTFPPPGSPGQVWSGGTISSDFLSGSPINSDITDGVQPGDTITFALVIENLGTSDGGAFDIIVRDILPPGFIIPPGGLNLKVVRGDGTPVSIVNAPADLFGAGLELTDPGQGVCAPYDATSGQNIVVLTYDLQLATDGSAAGILQNNAAIEQYSNEDNGAVNYVQDRLVYSDGASVDTGIAASNQGPVIAIFDPAISKVGSLEAGAVGLTGERLAWLITITNVGTVPGTDLVISDTLRSELAVEGAEIERGTATINGQVVTFNIPTLDPGEVIYATIYTTVIASPLDGQIENTVTLSGFDQNGQQVLRSYTTSISLVTGLPDTGYPPANE